MAKKEIKKNIEEKAKVETPIVKPVETVKKIAEEIPKGIKDRLTELEEQSKKKPTKDNKPFKLPFKARLTKRNIQANQVIAMVWNENNCVDLVKTTIINNTIRIGDTFHTVLSRNIGLYKGKYPFVHINKWSEKSFSPQESLEEAQDEKTLTYGHKYVAARILSDHLKSRMKGSASWIIWILVAGGIAYGIFSAFGGGGA